MYEFAILKIMANLCFDNDRKSLHRIYRTISYPIWIMIFLVYIRRNESVFLFKDDVHLAGIYLATCVFYITPTSDIIVKLANNHSIATNSNSRFFM